MSKKKSEEEKFQRMYVWLTPEEKRWFEQQAQKNPDEMNRSISYLVRQVLREYRKTIDDQ